MSELHVEERCSTLIHPLHSDEHQNPMASVAVHSSLTGSQKPCNLKLVASLQLIERICKCGCERKWKCLATSTALYFSNYECAPFKYDRLEFTGVHGNKPNKYDKDGKPVWFIKGAPSKAR